MDQKTIDELSRLVRDYEASRGGRFFIKTDACRAALACYMDSKEIAGFRHKGDVYVVDYSDGGKPNLVVLRQLVEIP